MEIALSSICGPDDVLTPLSGEDENLRRQLSGRSAQNYRLPWGQYTVQDYFRMIKKGSRLAYKNHQSAKLIQERLGPSIWDNYFTFCVERAPEAKLISHYQWLKMQGACKNPLDYIEKNYFRKILGSLAYADSSGSILVDKVYKMEQLPEAIQELSDRFDLSTDALQLPHNSVKKSAPVSTAEQEHLLELYQERLLDFFGLERAFYED
ncbi:hypothetical protein [Gilvibacter sediminis]|uniref:hypothetical protein n=1 Tax=Gilvibacter sediminis TaxID=379071 RepID=UPI0023509F2C|nr:hypothetical protein [Gilvibacter sediminis]MDC7999128.1 hypothetical protein [Gilvibacter sediminis]